MGELPEGVNLPPIKTPEILRSASVILSRECEGGHEILLGHRVPELVSFPIIGHFPAEEFVMKIGIQPRFSEENWELRGNTSWPVFCFVEGNG